jgi:hypothetical protein
MPRRPYQEPGSPLQLVTDHVLETEHACAGVDADGRLLALLQAAPKNLACAVNEVYKHR